MFWQRRRPLQPAMRAEDIERRRKRRLVLLAEALTWAGWLVGWFLVTAGAEGILRIFLDSTAWIYFVSAGALLVGASGYRPLITLLTEGVGFVKSRKA